MFLSSMIEIILKFVDVFKFYDRNHSEVCRCFLSSMIEIILKFVDVFKFYDRNHSEVCRCF